jgi:hypothetical protein
MKFPVHSLALAVAVGFCGGTSAPAQVFSTNFNSNDGGFVAALHAGSTGNQAPPSWVYGATAGVGANNGAWFVNNFVASVGDNAWTGLTLTSPAVLIGTAGNYQFRFDQRFSFEPLWDGGQLQVSVNGGGFTTVPNSAFTAGGYTGTINSDYPGLSLIGGQQAWTGDSLGYASLSYVTSTATLAFGAGDSVQFRFLGVWDSRGVGMNPGWVIDNVSVMAIPEPAIVAFGIAAGVVVVFSRRRKRRGRAA